MNRLLLSIVLIAMLNGTAFSQGSENCTLLGSIELPGSALGICIRDNIAFVADGDSGLYAIDINNPNDLHIVGNFETQHSVEDVTFSSTFGARVYIADGSLSGLRVIDVTNPSDLFELGFCPTTGEAHAVTINENYAYLATIDNLCVIDISNGSNPQQVGTYQYSSGAVHGVAVDGITVFVADWTGGLRLVDASTPATPQEIGFYENEIVHGVASCNGNVYITEYFAGIRAIDVDDTANPQGLGFYDTPGAAWGVAAYGNIACVADGLAGIRIIDISDSSNLREIGYYDTPGFAYRVAIVDSTIFVADGSSGMMVIQYEGATAIEPCIVSPKTLTLHQNSPNPFNSFTNIKYSLASPQNVSLRVYDVVGRLVKEFPDELKSAGDHVVKLDCGDLCSGLYIYQLRSEALSINMRMLLLK